MTVQEQTRAGLMSADLVSEVFRLVRIIKSLGRHGPRHETRIQNIQGCGPLMLSPQVAELVAQLAGTLAESPELQGARVGMGL